MKKTKHKVEDAKDINKDNIKEETSDKEYEADVFIDEDANLEDIEEVDSNNKQFKLNDELKTSNKESVDKEISDSQNLDKENINQDTETKTEDIEDKNIDDEISDAQDVDEETETNVTQDTKEITEALEDKNIDDEISDAQVVDDETESNIAQDIEETKSNVNVTYHLQEKPAMDFIENHKIKLIIALVVFMLIGSVGTYRYQLKAIQKKSEIVQLNVEEGAYFSDILQNLADDLVIKNKTAAKLYAKFNSLQDVAAGVYELDKSWDTKEIIQYLNTTIPHNDISVKFPEASWAKDIAHILASNFPYEEEDFIELWNNKEYIKDLRKEYKFIPKEVLDHSKDKKVLLEGFLYPDTYSFNVKSTKEEITEVILNNTEDKLSSITKEIEKTDLSFYETLILSSIVMYEAGQPEDQQIVSGVFRNRLDIDMALGSSVTVCYTLYEFDDWEECEKYDNLQIDSPYNTYIYAGLPIGPILNPSIEAIKNTINYKKNDYFYFVADAYEGGDGSIYYSKTLEEHEKKVTELSGR